LFIVNDFINCIIDKAIECPKRKERNQSSDVKRQNYILHNNKIQMAAPIGWTDDGFQTAEKSARSVFVGNIPYDTSEEQLKEIFRAAGKVLSFRLVYDRESGKPKGYGFCEYEDQETSLSAMRNLNGFEFNGRQLRVDSAAADKGKEDLAAVEATTSPYGEAVEPEKAPEAISRAVASLPPEQMFELMKQMKLCIQNNPTEARNMLLQNPQLAYALLQAQVVMRIVDPKVAMAMLHRHDTQVLL
jgi:cleavage stimulation factor subunit 2